MLNKRNLHIILSKYHRKNTNITERLLKMLLINKKDGYNSHCLNSLTNNHGKLWTKYEKNYLKTLDSKKAGRHWKAVNIGEKEWH